MPPNRATVSLGTDRFRHHQGIYLRSRAAKPAARSANRFSLSTLLQIVPKIPGGIDGVGDYALSSTKKLREGFGCETIFATFQNHHAPGSMTALSGRTQTGNMSGPGFKVLALERLASQLSEKYDHVLLHYVNYGFQKRGVPFRLLSILRALREKHAGKFVTVFHELYASGPPWTSAFWLQPLQIDLAKSVARLSDGCIVSSDNFRRELIRMVPHAEIELHPVPSGLGEPLLSADQIANRNPHQWAIFGGTGLAERSLRSFRQLMPRVPDSIAPQSLFVLGGAENQATRSLLVDLGIESDYRPRIAAADASEILKTCSFAWFNYFHRPDVETSVILKSSAFSSACAHAVISVFPHRGSAISLDDDRLPGPFFVASDRCEIPGADGRAKIAAGIYDWYRRHASSEFLVQAIAKTLGLNAAR